VGAGMTMPVPPVAVVGLGQLGGSLAAALTAAGREVSGWDVDPAARDAAAARGLTITQELGGVVVLAVPLPVMVTALDGLTLHPDATVTDLARWLRVAEVALAAGAVVVPVTASEHDDAVAAISHVPHLLAAALAAAAADAGPLALALAAGSFRDGTRVIGSDPAFVTAMVEGTAAPTAEALARVLAQLDRPWPELIAAGHVVVTRPTSARAVRVPLERAALLAVGRAGGAITGRLAAFLEGWVPDTA